jgi:hypothetical protein
MEAIDAATFGKVGRSSSALAHRSISTSGIPKRQRRRGISVWADTSGSAVKLQKFNTFSTEPLLSECPTRTLQAISSGITSLFGRLG